MQANTQPVVRNWRSCRTCARVRDLGRARLRRVLALTQKSATAPAAAASKPIEVKVVVVTMFEIGADAGDAAGEFQLWRERQKLTQQFPFAHHHDLYLNPETGVLGMVTGIGTTNSATAAMALGLDPRFDLSKAYWLVAGIAGGIRRTHRSGRLRGRNSSSTAISRTRSTRARSRRIGKRATSRAIRESPTTRRSPNRPVKCFG